MKQALIFNFKVIKERQKFAKIIFYETVITCLFATFLMAGKYPENFGSFYDLNYMTNNEKLMAFAFVLSMFIPVIASLPTGDIDSSEGNEKYFLLGKFGNKNYYNSKLITAFIFGFINSLYCLELFYILEFVAIDVSGTVYVSDGSISTDFLMPDLRSVYFNKMIITHPLILAQVCFVLTSLFGGFSACINYLINQFIDYEGIKYLGSFIVLFSLSFIAQFIPSVSYLISYFTLFHLNLNFDVFSEKDSHVLFIILMWYLVMTVLIILGKTVAEKRED